MFSDVLRDNGSTTSFLDLVLLQKKLEGIGQDISVLLHGHRFATNFSLIILAEISKHH